MTRKRSKASLIEQMHSFSFHKTACFFFFFLFFYGAVLVCRCQLPEIGSVAYLHHAVDYGVGFCSKLLPGAIFNLLVRKPTSFSATIYEYVLLFSFFAAVSLLSERLVLSFSEKKRVYIFLLLFFYLTGPGTFANLWIVFGVLDMNWIYLSVLFVVCLRNRKTRVLAPLFPMVAILIHFGAILNYVPFFLLLILFETIVAVEKKERKQLLCIFLAATVLASGSFLYFSINEKKNVKMDINEFHQYLQKKGVSSSIYYDFAFFYNDNVYGNDEFIEITGSEEKYRELDIEELFPERRDNLLVRVLNKIYAQIQVQMYLYSRDENERSFFLLSLAVIAMLSPVLLFLSRFLFLMMRAADNKCRRLVFFGMMVFPYFVVFGSLFFSTDLLRWFYHAFLIGFTIVLYVLYVERDTDRVIDMVQRELNRFPKKLIGCYSFIYCFTVVSPVH